MSDISKGEFPDVLHDFFYVLLLGGLTFYLKEVLWLAAAEYYLFRPVQAWRRILIVQ